MRSDSVQASKHINLTQAPVERLISRLALPSIITMLISAIYNMTDTFFIGRLGTSATGAIGIAYPIMILMQAIGFLFGKGIGTTVGRELGGRQMNKANRTVTQGLVYVVGLTSLLMLLGLLFLYPLVIFLGCTESMQAYCIEYIRYLLYAMPFKACGVVFSCILRFQGCAKQPMYGLVAGAVINIILNPIFIWYFNLGVSGAAIVTMIGEIASCLIMLAACLRINGALFSFREFSLSWTCLKAIVSNGASSFFKNSLASVSTILVNTAAHPYGDAVIAAFSIVSRLVHICQSVYFGIGEGYQPVCSYNYGAKLYKRVLSGFWFCIRSGAILIPLVVLSFLFPEQIIALFRRDDPEVIRWGSLILRAQMATLPLLPISATGFITLQGIGQNLKATLIGCARQGLFLIPLLLTLPRVFGLPGLIAVQPCSDILSVLLGSALLFPSVYQLKQRTLSAS